MNTAVKPERDPSSTTTNPINHLDTRSTKMTPPSLYSKFSPTTSASTSSIFHTRSRTNSGYPLLYSSALSSSYDAFFTDSVTGASFIAPYDDVHDSIDDGAEQERIVFDTHSTHDEHEQYRQQYQRQWSCEPGLSEPTILAGHHHHQQQQPQFNSHQRQFSTHKMQYHHEQPLPSLEHVHRQHTLQQIQVHEPAKVGWSEEGSHENSCGEDESDDKSEEEDDEDEDDHNDFDMHQDMEDSPHSIDTSGSVSTHLSLPSLVSASSISTTLSTSSSSDTSPQAHAPSQEGTHHHSTNFISESQFLHLADEYLLSLSPKKREKALLSNAMYQKILMVLLQPKNTQVSTAQFRFWAKKMFTLSTTATHHLVCHGGKPVATKECLYDVLVYCHRKSAHGGRDKTSAEVRQHYSWVPKELIARFVKHCPLCHSRRNNLQKQGTQSGSGTPSTHNSSGASDTPSYTSFADSPTDSLEPQPSLTIPGSGQDVLSDHHPYYTQPDPAQQYQNQPMQYKQQTHPGWQIQSSLHHEKNQDPMANPVPGFYAVDSRMLHLGSVSGPNFQARGHSDQQQLSWRGDDPAMMMVVDDSKEPHGLGERGDVAMEEEQDEDEEEDDGDDTEDSDPTLHQHRPQLFTPSTAPLHHHTHHTHQRLHPHAHHPYQAHARQNPHHQYHSQQQGGGYASSQVTHHPNGHILHGRHPIHNRARIMGYTKGIAPPGFLYGGGGANPGAPASSHAQNPFSQFRAQHHHHHNYPSSSSSSSTSSTGAAMVKPLEDSHAGEDGKARDMSGAAGAAKQDETDSNRNRIKKEKPSNL